MDNRAFSAVNPIYREGSAMLLQRETDRNCRPLSSDATRKADRDFTAKL
jgi:hypothetical protein